MTTRILFLSADPAHQPIVLDVDDEGRALPRGDDAAAMQPSRSVLVVPGGAVRIERLELQAHSEAQAQAAARAVLEGRLARPGALHVALDRDAGSTSRTVAAVDPDVLRAWLARAAALGLQPDAAVPEALLLPVPHGGAIQRDTVADLRSGDSHGSVDAGHVNVLDAGDRWLVRGPGLAFSAEPALAGSVLAGRETRFLAGRPEDFARNALRPQVDLLQGAFAPAARNRPSGRRRLAWLAAALLASPLVLVGAQALRLEIAARTLESEATAAVREALPAAGSATRDGLQSRLGAAREPQVFAAASGALFAAVDAREGTHLLELEYQRGDAVRAVLFHAGADDIEALRASLAAEGWRLVEGGSTATPGGLRTGLALEPDA